MKKEEWLKKGYVDEPVEKALDAKTAVDEVVTTEIQRYLDKNINVLQAILDNSVKSYNARKASDKARNTVLKQLNDVDTKSKLAACTSKNPEECEVYIVEGDSAGGTVKTARNRKTQAVLPLRGKEYESQSPRQGARAERIYEHEREGRCRASAWLSLRRVGS